MTTDYRSEAANLIDALTRQASTDERMSAPLAWLLDEYAEPNPELVDRQREAARDAAELLGYPTVVERHFTAARVRIWHGMHVDSRLATVTFAPTKRAP